MSSPITSEVAAYTLRLYVAGQSPKSVAAIRNLKKLCEQLPQPYEVQIVDLAVNPSLAQRDEIVAVPTLVRSLPPPIKRIIGDLSNTDRVLLGLDLLLDADGANG